MSKLDRFKRKKARSDGIDTDAEQTLWENLYRIPIEGSHFRKQVQIGKYRSDFGSHRLKLLVEVDGLIHDDALQVAHDEHRDNWLTNEGYRVIRFSNDDVTTDMNRVLKTIVLAIERQRLALRLDDECHPTPALTRRPSPSRGG